MSLIESARKEWYRRATRKRLARGEWSTRYWRDDEDARVVACRLCPKFDDRGQRCSVPFGTPVRKCVVASLEAHLHDTTGMTTLELGYGKRSLAKDVVEQSGGIWTGLEPNAARAQAAAIGGGGYGHAGRIPFPSETFDLVFGIQSIEHWEEKQPSLPQGLTYDGCLREIWRVLKPGGSIYFDAPIHLHGHDMFVLGDLSRIRGLFDSAALDWAHVREVALRPTSLCPSTRRPRKDRRLAELSSGVGAGARRRDPQAQRVAARAHREEKT